MKVNIYNLFQYSKKEVVSHIKKPSAWKKVAPHHSFVPQKRSDQKKEAPLFVKLSDRLSLAPFC